MSILDNDSNDSNDSNDFSKEGITPIPLHQNLHELDDSKAKCITYWQLALNIPHQPTWLYQFNPDLLQGVDSLSNNTCPQIGELVWVDFNRKKEPAIVIEACMDMALVEHIQQKTTIKAILQLSGFCLSSSDLAYARFIAQYYHEGLGEALFLGMPKAFKKAENWPDKIEKYMPKIN